MPGTETDPTVEVTDELAWPDESVVGDHDAYAVVSGGEYATAYGLDRVDATTGLQTTYHRQGGTVDVKRGFYNVRAVERVTVEAGTTTRAWAAAVAGDDPAGALRDAREFFDGE